ncbi:MAG: cation-translocating P-type ATPase [Clostridium sp.]|uniref:cation-translocating P-type ATPase n=1 Tax=Clostridium sp. TaxID=1506 RepID=UPI002A849D3B|nr:cation-translocating P-type ATPase [Clostridium sp.]MDY5099690.1 cation-translocating P-type ATPase [Clostridium sp.]
MTEQTKNQLKGLTKDEARVLQEKFGKNRLVPEKKENFFLKIIQVLKEPMFLLLIAAAVIYFLLGEPRDGTIMLVFVVGIISIDVIQEWKTDKTLNALKNLSAPHITVIRDGEECTINSEDLVPGDLMMIAEGVKLPADGKVIRSNDLCIDESSLTGEAEGVWKCTDDSGNKDYWKKDHCYAGTLVTQGTGVILVEKIGAETDYGKIGINVAESPDRPTPMEKQTRKLVKICAMIAAVLFLMVCIITYFNLPDREFKERIIESILSGITLAMAMIPEEFPVILTVFLSMGAWRLAKKSSLVRRLPSVETLGAVSVLCVDKTGTITMNKMRVRECWAFNNNITEINKIMGMACEIDAYDPMEYAILDYCEDNNISKDELFKGDLISEYSFTNERKMMGHVWKVEDEAIIAAKGSAEKILTLCRLEEEEKKIVENKIFSMSSKGLRVLGIGRMILQDERDIPETLEECRLEFLGLVGLQDPPRENVKDDIASCIKAGIRVVMITGDNGITASAIAKQVGIPHSSDIITGDELSAMTDEKLKERIKDVSIFSRVMPEHKMRIVKAFKENGDVVAMTGDGVNDAPALKYADIGIAMGKRGSEVSREAADLILLDDNFSTIVDTIKDGRRIYDNMRKAIGYVFTIHIPIAFASLLAPMLDIRSSMLLLLPVHVVLLELLIDPTCSIVLERQPSEIDIMERKPRNPKESILTASILIKSIIQGIVLFGASFASYYLYLNNNPGQAEIARSIGLAIIMLSNMLLVQVNSSESEFAYRSMMNLKKDPVMWAVGFGTLIGLGLILYTPIAEFLSLAPLTLNQVLRVIVTSFIAVMWYDVVKIFKKVRRGRIK